MATVYNKMTAIADAIRAKNGKTNRLTLDDMAIDIKNISGGSGIPSKALGNKLYSFGIVSDVHVNYNSDSQANKLEKALTLFENLGATLVCTAGDIADTGRLDELNRFKNICDSHSNLIVHTCRGNHDKPLLDSEWADCLGHDNNYEIIYNNDVFIFWSILNGESSTQSYKDHFEWLRSRLNRYKGSRIFIFMHYPPSGYSGLADDQYYGFSASSTIDDEFVNLLNQIKNVTVFTGHTHYRFSSQEVYNNMNAFRFNSSDVNLIHVPSSAYCRDDSFGSSGESEGWLVDAYEYGFVLHGYDFDSGKMVEDTEYFFATDNVPPRANSIVLDDVDCILSAGQSAKFNVTLSDEAVKTINITCTDANVTVSPATLHFTIDNWNIPQTITVTAPQTISEASGCMVNLEAEGMAKKVISVMLSTNAVPPTIAREYTWYRGTTPRSSITEINFVNSNHSVPTTYTETWDASEGQNGGVTAYVDGTTLYIAGNGASSIRLTDSAQKMFDDPDKTDRFTSVTTINGLGLLDTSACTNMRSMFEHIESLVSVDVGDFDVSNVTDMNYMFCGCYSLSQIMNLNKWNTMNLKYANYMFTDCQALTSLDLSAWDTTNLREIGAMFSYCKKLTSIDFTGWNTLKIRDMWNTFYSCLSLVNLDLSNFITPNLESEINGLFYDCRALETINLSNLDTTNVTEMKDVFRNTKSLKTIIFGNNFKTSNVTTMRGMFNDAASLNSLDLSHFDTSNVTDMESMFYNCVKLTSLNVNSFNTSKVIDMARMFSYCENLITLDISNFDTRSITENTYDGTDYYGLYKFAYKSGIKNLVVGQNFVQDYNLLTDIGSDKGMFYVSDSNVPLVINGANDVLKTYNFARDNRSVTFGQGILVDAQSIEFTDSRTAEIGVSLSNAENTTINVSVNNNLFTVTPSNLTFTTNNYNVKQYITVTASSAASSSDKAVITLITGSGRVQTINVSIVANVINAPVIKEEWYNSATPRSSITEINIVNSASEVPAYTETWDVSDDGDGSVNAYINGTTVYIAGNGAGAIKVKDEGCYYMFSDPDEVDYFTNLTAINGLNLLDTSEATNMGYMFRSCESLQSVDVSNFDTSNVERMHYMFRGCASLTNLDLSNFNTAKVQRMYSMFKECTSLVSVDLSSFDTSSVTNMYEMFYECGALKSLNLSSFNTANVTDMHAMFTNCVSLETLTLSSNFTTANVTTMAEMFDHCDVLTNLDISSFDTRAIASSGTSTGLYRFARKSGIKNLIVGEHFVQDYNMMTAGSSGMFYVSSSDVTVPQPLTITGANSVLKTYNFSKDNRTVTFVN